MTQVVTGVQAGNVLTVDTQFSVQYARNRDGVYTWQLNRAQRDCLGNGGLLGAFWGPRGFVLMYPYVWRHVWLRFVRLGGWKTWTWLKLDIMAVVNAVIYRAYIYGQSEGCGEIEVENSYLSDSRTGCLGCSYLGGTRLSARPGQSGTNLAVRSDARPFGVLEGGEES